MTKYVPHRFGPNETLSGILKKYNSHAATAEQIAMLMVQYNELNGKQVLQFLGFSKKRGSLGFVSANNW